MLLTGDDKNNLRCIIKVSQLLWDSNQFVFTMMNIFMEKYLWYLLELIWCHQEADLGGPEII